MPYNLGIYGTRLFSRYNPALNHQQLTELQHSGFTYVNLAMLNIDQNANLYYNSTPIVVDGVFANYNYLPELVARLKSSGSVKHVFFTIGGSGSSDFANVATLLATDDGKTALIESLSALTSAVPVDGFDFDEEQGYDNAASLAKFAQIISGPAAFGGLMVTYCPFNEESFWNDALKQTWQVDQQFGLPQSVGWWNLQCYSGGAGNDPVQWAKSLPKNAGVSDPKSFVVPGVGAAGSDPASVRAFFNQYAGTGINGGFVYAFEGIPAPYTAREYADAIVQGLEGVRYQKKAS